MAFGLLDYMRRRKLCVLLSVCVIVVIFVLFRSFSSRGYAPGNSKTGDSIIQLTFDDLNDNTNLRTSNSPAPSPSRDRDTNVENSNSDNVPMNKGNIAQVHPGHPLSLAEEKKKEIEYPERGVEIRPKNGEFGKQDSQRGPEYPERGIEIRPDNGEFGKQDSELGPNSAGSEQVSHQEVDSVKKIDDKLDSRAEGIAHIEEDGAGGDNLNDGRPAQARPDDTLYVHSSMPVGPALKIPHTERQRAVVDAIKHAWSSYKKYAWGQDDLLPLSKSHSSNDYGMAMTMVDSLDTLWLAGLQEEFNEARNWIAENLRFDTNRHKVIVFEVNIRVVGGLLSAYHLSQDKMFLEKAVEIADRLLPAFGTPSGLPVNRVDLQHGLTDVKRSTSPNYGTVNIAEAGSLQLEFRDLSRATGKSKYQQAADHDLNIILDSSSGGLYPQYFSVGSGRSSSSTFTVGAGADSFYEYLLKQWVQCNKAENKFLDRYTKAADAIKSYLIGYSKPSSLPYLGTKSGSFHGYLQSTMEHLACFYPGLLALGLMNDLHPEQRSLAEGLTQACYTAYSSTTSGLAADSFLFNTSPNGKSDYARASDPKNIQRPETVESLFVMYRLTKDPKYREWGWEIFNAFNSNMKVEGGFASVGDVNRNPSPRTNKMESFFVAETLKYLFLLFGDNDSVLALNEWVFNTEAHPLPVWNDKSQPQMTFNKNY